MPMSAKLERALVSSDELALLSGTHHPEIYELDRKELVAVQSRLRDLRGKARTVTRHKQREEKGKSAPRGKAFPGSSEQPLKRKQLLAAAVKRVNKEIDRRDRFDAKAMHVEAAHKALAQVRAANFASDMPASRTAGSGLQPKASTKRRRIVHRGRVGSILKQNKVGQAIRDARP